MIRTAVLVDVDAVAALEQECLGADAWSRWLVDQGIRGALPTVHYVVEVDPGTSRVVGHAVASIVGDIAELQRLAVTAERRRGGVASRLLEAVVSRADAARADRVLLEVRADNAGAIAFYASRGFAEIDRRPRYYRDGTTAVVMLRGLARKADVPGGTRRP